MIRSSRGWPLRARPRFDFPALRLTGERVLVRPPEIGDWADWASLRERSRDHLVPFEPAWHPEGLTEEFFLRRLARQSRDWRIGLTCSFLIFTKHDNAIIGGVNLTHICRGAGQYCTLGYWLGAPYQGQGYMNEALRLALIYGFDTLQLHRVNAATLPHNGRSMKVLRRLGFEEEGYAKSYLRINDEWQDHILFGLTEEKFQVKRGIVV